MSLSSNLLQSWTRSRAIDRQPLILPPRTLVTEAAACMSQCRASCVLVVEQQRLVGIFTERDVVRMTAADTQLKAVAIQEVMTFDPISVCIDDDQSIFSVLYLLHQHQIRHLPVVDKSGQVVGVITQSTLLQALDPVEMYATIEILRQETQDRTAQLSHLNDQLQQEIAQHQQEIQVRTVLEQQLLEQNAQLQKAIEAAEAANLVKRAFLVNMSHELRTPLHAILGFTQLLQDDTCLSSEHQEHLTIIRHSGEHLLNLINNLLEMSKMKAALLMDSKEEFDLFTTYDLDSTQPEIFEPSSEALAKLTEGIAALPPDWLADFRQGIIEGDLDWVLTLIAQIQECNEPLANALASLANTFQFEELLALTQKSSH